MPSPPAASATLPDLLAEEALRGERQAQRMRWLFMGAGIVVFGLMLFFGRYPEAALAGTALLGAGLACNVFLGLWLRSGLLPSWLSYFSVSLDVLIVAVYNYLASIYASPLAVATSPTYILFLLVLYFVALRHKRRLLIYALALALLSSNLAYYLLYPTLKQDLLTQAYAADPVSMVIRSLFLAMFGVALYFLPQTITRLLRKQTQLTADQHETETRHRAELEEQVAARTAELMRANQSLRQALDEVQTLSGLLPICTTCKKIRDDHGYWQGVEDYIRTHSQADFTHGICPDCLAKSYPEVYARMQQRARDGQGPSVLNPAAPPTKEEPS
jgi:hypothetical protein